MQEYQPFAYPPDFKLAQLHKSATMPGKYNPETSVKCPCCGLLTKQPLSSWFSRSIDHDFKQFGGAIITYFWLVKVYGILSAIILLVYSSFLIISMDRVCSSLKDDKLACDRFLGVWIVTNMNLYELLKKEVGSIARLVTLRDMAFVILLVGNCMGLYVSGRFKRRYPQPKTIASFALIFRNVNLPLEQFQALIAEKFPATAIHEALKIKKMQPYYSLYYKKIEKYYQCLIEQDQKKKNKFLLELQQLDTQCAKHEVGYQIDSDRCIVVFKTENDRNAVRQFFKLQGADRAKYLLGFSQGEAIYCEDCPIPDQIIWNNLGENQRKKIQLKVLSVLYFFATLAGSYMLLFFCMKVVYNREILPQPWNAITASIVMTALVPIAISFRRLMDKLSEMRRPNTQTSRTLFVVLTTVLFHFIYYIIIPTFYLRFNAQEEKEAEKNKILYIITNSTFNFLVVQFLLAYFDLMYRGWNKRLKQVQDEGKPIGCQKILHREIQYPRFPIEFKLIILFKIFSFMILFTFESPLIMFLCFLLLLFIYFRDKFALYRHYRMEIIDNGVQFMFLKFYSVFFSAYTFLVYSLTQRFYDKTIEFYAALGLTILFILVQLFVIQDRIFEDEAILPSTIGREGIEDSYARRYAMFRRNVTSGIVDGQIGEYLIRNGLGSIQTEESLEKRLVA